MKPDSGKSFPVYLFYGPEEFLIQQELQALMDRMLSEKERGLNLHVFDGDEHSAQEIVRTAQTLPMFSRYRFVLVKSADRIDEEGVEVLLRYAEDPSPSTCLVLSAQTLGAWKGHRTKIERVGKVIECSRLKGKALGSWIKSRMAEKGKSLSDQGAEYLIEVVGDHLHQLENALEQIYLSVGGKKTVDLSDLEGMVSEVKLNTVFDLTEAIGRQDIEKALNILNQVLEAKVVPFKKEEAPSVVGDPIPLLLSMIARQYRQIWRVRKVSTNHNVEDTARALRMSPWMVRKTVDQARHFPEPALREGLLECHRTDLAIKRGRGPKNLLMERLVMELCRPKMMGGS